MAKKICKDCPERKSEPIKATETRVMKKFSFPSLWLVVEAKNLEEATKKVKVMVEYQNKSI